MKESFTNRLRYNEEDGCFELRCEQCAQWQVLDLYSWAPKHGLRRCRACILQRQREKRAKQPVWPGRLYCKSGRHRWVPANIYTPPNGKNRSCRLCKNERDKRTIAEERAYLRSLSERAA